jgi:opacity protein-like surface antigen
MRALELCVPMCRRSIDILAGMTLACGLCAAAQAADAISPASVPADGKITITDYGYRDWGPELVQYTLDPARIQPRNVVLTDAHGGSVPCQIDGNTLSFVASVPKGGSATGHTPRVGVQPPRPIARIGNHHVRVPPRQQGDPV